VIVSPLRALPFSKLHRQIQPARVVRDPLRRDRRPFRGYCARAAVRGLVDDARRTSVRRAE